LLSLYEVTEAELVGDLTRAARASRSRPWWHDFRDIVRPQVAQLLGYETTARVFLEFAQVLEPGPFQTREYAAAVIKAEHGGALGDAVLRRSLDLRQRRGRLRLNRPGVEQIVLLLDELVLLRPIGGAPVMRRQMLSLLALMEREGVQIEVLPLATGAHPSLEGSFKVLRSDGGQDDVVYLGGGRCGTLVRDNSAQIADYTRRFDRMRAQAWTGDQARHRIAEAADIPIVPSAPAARPPENARRGARDAL
jgi:hypothetical protein